MVNQNRCVGSLDEGQAIHNKATGRGLILTVSPGRRRRETGIGRRLPEALDIVLIGNIEKSVKKLNRN
jgi:hypothetical protein